MCEIFKDQLKQQRMDQKRIFERVLHIVKIVSEAWN